MCGLDKEERTIDIVPGRRYPRSFHFRLAKSRVSFSTDKRRRRKWVEINGGLELRWPMNKSSSEDEKKKEGGGFFRLSTIIRSKDRSNFEYSTTTNLSLSLPLFFLSFFSSKVEEGKKEEDKSFRLSG